MLFFIQWALTKCKFQHGTVCFKGSLKLTVFVDKVLNFINIDEKYLLSLHFELLQKLKQLNLIFLIIHLM